jgi:WD40 repeat protein
VAETKLTGGIYALTFSPDGKFVAAAGEDGRVRLISTADGKVTKEFVPVPVTGVQISRVNTPAAARR